MFTLNTVGSLALARVPDAILVAFKLLRDAPSPVNAPFSVVGNLAAAIVPEEILVAFRLLNEAPSPT